MSTRNNNDFITPNEIIEAYNKYKNEFLVINIEKVRPNDPKKPKVWYADVNFKSDKSKDLIKPVIKVLNLTTASSIRPPNKRQYEQLKVTVRKNDERNPDSNFGKAMEIVCNVFEENVKYMVEKKIISDNKKDKESKVLPSVKPKTPMQVIATDKEGNAVELENPMFYFNLNAKNYNKLSPDELSKIQIMDDVHYDDEKTPYVKDFDINIYDLNKPIGKKFELAIDNNDNQLNNSNIHEFLKPKSIISGSIIMQCIISNSGSFNLNTKLYKSLYVSKSDYNSNDNDDMDDDDLESMTTFAQLTKTIKKENKEEEKEEEISESEEEISDDEE
jgi:hypothetical protein